MCVTEKHNSDLLACSHSQQQRIILSFMTLLGIETYSSQERGRYSRKLCQNIFAWRIFPFSSFVTHFNALSVLGGSLFCLYILYAHEIKKWLSEDNDGAQTFGELPWNNSCCATGTAICDLLVELIIINIMLLIPIIDDDENEPSSIKLVPKWFLIASQALDKTWNDWGFGSNQKYGIMKANKYSYLIYIEWNWVSPIFNCLN